MTHFFTLLNTKSVFYEKKFVYESELSYLCSGLVKTIINF